MAKNKKNIAEIVLDGLEYPIRVGKKEKLEGVNTLVRITIRTRIEKKFEDRFEADILGIISDSDDYIGLQQLSNKIISYLNSIDARLIDLTFRFPFFIEKHPRSNKQKQLMKYKCELKIKRDSAYYYSRRYSVEVPVVIKEYLIPGLQKEILEIPAIILTELEGLDVYFIEDIVDLVEKQVEKLNYNLLSVFEDNDKFSLLEKIEEKLCEEFNTDKCSVKFVTRKNLYTYSTELSGEIYKPSLINIYDTDHIFV